MSFKRWLLRQCNRNDRVGDLACDVRSDPDWPRGKDLKRFVEYLANRGVEGKVMVSLQIAWDEWKVFEAAPPQP